MLSCVPLTAVLLYMIQLTLRFISSVLMKSVWGTDKNEIANPLPSSLYKRTLWSKYISLKSRHFVKSNLWVLSICLISKYWSNSKSILSADWKSIYDISFTFSLLECAIKWIYTFPEGKDYYTVNFPP